MKKLMTVNDDLNLSKNRFLFITLYVSIHCTKREENLGKLR